MEIAKLMTEVNVDVGRNLTVHCFYRSCFVPVL